MILALFLISILIGLAIFCWILLTVNYLPAWEPTNISNLDPETNLYLEVLTPLVGFIPEQITTPEYIKNNYLDVNYEDYLAFLKTKGEITFISESGTYHIIKTKAGNLPVKNYGGEIGTLNQPYYWLYHGKRIYIYHFNFAAQPDYKPQVPEVWSKDMIKQPLGKPQILYQDVTSLKDPLKISNIRSYLGIYQKTGSLISIPIMQDLAEQLGFNSSKFLDQIISYAPTDQIPGYTLIDNQTSEDYVYDELNYDLCMSFLANPESVIFLFPCGDVVILPMWVSASNGDLPNMWSSSISFSGGVQPEDFKRINEEFRLLWLCGINMFQAAGDQGAWSSQINNSTQKIGLDIRYPDTSKGILLSSYTITVGGYSVNAEYPQNNWQNIAIPMVLPDNSFFGTAGGFSRGYHTDPGWKYQVTRKYINYTKSITYSVKPDGYLAARDVNLDTQGLAVPVLIGPGGFIFNNMVIAGSSLAAPYYASSFALLQAKVGKIILLTKYLYENPELTSKFVYGTTSIFNLPGYVATQDTRWDPVQGLGIPDFDKIGEYYLSKNVNLN